MLTLTLWVLVLTGMMLACSAIACVCGRCGICSKWKKNCYPLRLSSFLEFCGKFGGFVSTDGGLAKTAFTLVMPLSADCFDDGFCVHVSCWGLLSIHGSQLDRSDWRREFALWYVRRRRLTKEASLLLFPASPSSSSSLSTVSFFNGQLSGARILLCLFLFWLLQEELLRWPVFCCRAFGSQWEELLLKRCVLWIRRTSLWIARTA